MAQQINVNPNAAISSSFKLSDTSTQASEGNIVLPFFEKVLDFKT